MPFTRTTTEESAERSSEIQQIKIQIPAPGTGTLHITLQAVSKVLRSSFAQKDQDNLVYSRLNMSQCHGEFWHRLGCISKNIARKCLFPFTWHLQGCLGDSVPSFCLLCSGRTSIAEESVWRTAGKHGEWKDTEGTLTWSACKREDKKRNLTAFQGKRRVGCFPKAQG